MIHVEPLSPAHLYVHNSSTFLQYTYCLRACKNSNPACARALLIRSSVLSVYKVKTDVHKNVVYTSHFSHKGVTASPLYCYCVYLNAGLWSSHNCKVCTLGTFTQPSVSPLASAINIDSTSMILFVFLCRRAVNCH